MGIDQLQAELSQQMTVLAGLEEQSQILNSMYFDAFAGAKLRVARYDIFKDRLEALKSTVYGNTISRQSYYAPILRFPTELTIQVFMLCWDYGEVPLANCSEETLYALRLPWSLSGTCRTWRDISIQLPCLWSNIMLSFGALETPPFILKIWIQRCGSHPASLYWLRPSGGEDVTIQPGCIQKLRFALKRVRAINVRTLQSSQATRNMSVEQRVSHESMLQVFQQGIDLLLRGHRRNLFKGTNELRWVAPLLSWEFSPLLPTILRVTGITHFTFALREDPGLLEVLSHMPRLEHANLFIPLPTQRSISAMGAAQTVTLPSLRTLCVAAPTFGRTADFLRHLIAPALIALDIASGIRSNSLDFPPRELVQFLEQSHNKLQHLGMQDASSPFPFCVNSTLKSLFALQNVEKSLRTCYIQAHPRALTDPKTFVPLLGKMPNMRAFRIGSADKAITFGHPLTQQMNWFGDILCEEELVGYLKNY